MMRAQNKWPLLALLIASLSYGSSADKSQIAYIVADRAEYNQKLGISTYYGHVKVDQGSTHLRGDKMIVYNSADRRNLEKIIAMGHPAEYRTLPDNQAQELVTYGLIIEYYPIVDKLVLREQAKAQQGENVITGEQIEYQLTDQVMISSPPKKSRTVIVIQQDN